MVIKRYFGLTPRMKVCEASESLLDEDGDIDWQPTASETPRQTPLRPICKKISSVFKRI